nr:amidohydrolase family protein [Kibdelosporangium sp. MJ126-NF4]
MATSAAVAASSLGLPTPGAAATADERHSGRIDTHHHATPPAIQEWAVQQGLLPADRDRWPRWAKWDLNQTLATMDASGIAVGVASAPLPTAVVEGDPVVARQAARVINEALAELARDHPTRFGFLAYVPLPHTDVALSEIGYALDQLDADGVLMMTHVGQTPETARYLGDPSFTRVFAELNERKAVVLVHPDNLPGDHGRVIPGVDNYVADYMLATTRAALSMMTSKTLQQCPDLSVILSHGGGFLPYIGGRLELAGRLGEGPDVQSVRTALKRFYYDTAQPTSPYATPTLLHAAPSTHILYGSDWPATPAKEVATTAGALDRDPLMDRHLRDRINRRNALDIFPSIARRLHHR